MRLVTRAAIAFGCRPGGDCVRSVATIVLPIFVTGSALGFGSPCSCRLASTMACRPAVWAGPPRRLRRRDFADDYVWRRCSPLRRANASPRGVMRSLDRSACPLKRSHSTGALTWHPDRRRLPTHPSRIESCRPTSATRQKIGALALMEQFAATAAAWALWVSRIGVRAEVLRRASNPLSESDRRWRTRDAVPLISTQIRELSRRYLARPLGSRADCVRNQISGDLGPPRRSSDRHASRSSGRRRIRTHSRKAGPLMTRRQFPERYS